MHSEKQMLNIYLFLNVYKMLTWYQNGLIIHIARSFNKFDIL